jgi:RNA polymerase sigma factor (sigma-70 family)
MSAAGSVVVAPEAVPSDTELVAAVRAGEDSAFEELYRRYRRRIAVFVRRLVRDEGRAEDVTQEAFFSALRRMRATDSEIAFKPWIYEIARNAAIDSWRRGSRSEEVSIDHAEALRPSDRSRLVGSTSPDSALIAKERMEHLRGALDELSDAHHRIIVMRELEGLSYREIGERLELTRPAVESTLFRARRRLEHEYGELEAGRRCDSMAQVIARMAEGIEARGDASRLARHARRCGPCRRRARQLGVEPLAIRRAAARAAALLPLPGLLRRRGDQAGQAGAASGGHAGGALTPLGGALGELGVALGERAAALAAAVALAGAGGAVLSGAGPFDGIASPEDDRGAVERQAGGRDGDAGAQDRAGGAGDGARDAGRQTREGAVSGDRRGRLGERGPAAKGRGSGTPGASDLTLPGTSPQSDVPNLLPLTPPSGEAPSSPDPSAPPPEAPEVEGPSMPDPPAPPAAPEAEVPAGSAGPLPVVEGAPDSATTASLLGSGT